MQEEKSFYQTCHEAVASNKDVQLTLQSLKEECLAAANSGKSEIRFSITNENKAAIKILESMLPVISRDSSGHTGRSNVFSLI